MTPADAGESHTAVLSPSSGSEAEASLRAARADGTPAADAPRYGPRWAWALAVGAVTLLGGVLRLASLARVPNDPYYDAAVRSMGGSFHNLLFGAFDPTAMTSIDKPPVDLWLQVLSTKVVGFSAVSLKLPAAVAATLAVALLYDVVRRLAGREAGLVSALALAVLPVSVLTSRSDTMDSLMMALLVAVAWLVVRAAQSGRLRWLLLAGFALGVDFNVKLFEALLAGPALALLALLGERAVSRWRRSRGVPAGGRRSVSARLALAGTVFVVTALGWLVAVSLIGGSRTPYAIGSSNGSIWNAVFVFNGSDRILKSADTLPGGGVSGATRPLRVGRDGKLHRAAPVSEPGLTRLFVTGQLGYGALIGMELAAALGLGGLALAATSLRRKPDDTEDPAPCAAARRGAVSDSEVSHQHAVSRAGVVGMATWLITGLLLFSEMSRLHPRYLEGFTPAIAAVLGISAAALLARAREPAIAVGLAVAVALLVAYFAAVQPSASSSSWGIALALAGASGAAILLLAPVARRRHLRSAPGWWCAALLAMLATALFAAPLARDANILKIHASDDSNTPRLGPSTVNRLSGYLRAHQRGARYEFAAGAPALAADVIVKDARPVLMLAGTQGVALISPAQLRDYVARGEVDYVVARGPCPAPPKRIAACTPVVRWALEHGVDVTPQVLPGHRGLVYRLIADARR